MNRGSNSLLVLFKNTFSVMRAEKICTNYSINYQVIPVPTHISSECGMCLEIGITDLNFLKKKFQENNLSYIITEK